MGTINYGNNEFFNIGMNLNQFDNILNYEDRQFEYETEFNFLIDEIDTILSKYDFEFFNITYKIGYYEGFYFNIDFKYSYLDDHKERLLVLKELTQLGKLLKEFCCLGLVEYSPGWCMGYYDEETTSEDIKKTIRELKQKFLKYPTYRTLKKGA